MERRPQEEGTARSKVRRGQGGTIQIPKSTDRCVGCDESLKGQAGGRGGKSLQAMVTLRKMGSHGRMLSKGVTGSRYKE